MFYDMQLKASPHVKVLRRFVAISFTNVELRLFQSIITDVFSTIHVWQLLSLTNNKTFIGF